MDVDQFGPSGLMMAPSLKYAPNNLYRKDSEQLVNLGQDKQTETLRIIQQYLSHQGYQEVANQLAQASNIPMEDPVVTDFRQQVVEGQFEDIPQLVANLVRNSSPMSMGNENISGLVAQKREFLVSEQIRMIEYLLFEQKYMELVASGSTIEAITVLQTELHQRAPIQERLHELAQLILLAQSSSCIAASPVDASDEKAQEDNIVGINVVEKKDADSKLMNGYITVGEIKVEQSNTLEKCEDSEQKQTLVTKKKEKLLLNGTATDCPQQHNEKELQQQTVVAMQRIPIQANIVELKRHAAWWQGPGKEGRQNLVEKVQQVLQSNSMLQPNRLETIMQQALTYQLNSCRFHNMHVDKFSLLTDHQCSTDVIPQHCIATLKAHQDQVWLVQFSNVKGDKLASVCKDGSLCIWQINWINKEGLQSVEVKCSMAIQTKSQILQSLNWANTSDDYLITAGKEKVATIWNINTGKQVLKLEGHSSSIQSAIFSPNDKKVFTIGIDQNLIIWEINLKELNMSKREISRIRTKHCVDMTLKGNTLVSINKTMAYCYVFTNQALWQDKNAEDSEMAENNGCNEDYMEGGNGDEVASDSAMLIDQEDYEDIGSPNVRVIEANDTITAINLSKDGMYLLANISMTKPNIVCWHLPSGESCGKYRGHEQRNYILRPAFGGLNERLILCGSEDSSICIWHRQSCELIARIQGHYQIVNSVSWSSTNALLFASGSDDTQVKLWSVQHIEATILTNRSKKRQSNRRTCEEEKQNEEIKSGAIQINNHNVSRSSNGSKSDNNSDNDDSEDSSSSSSDDSNERGQLREDREDILYNMMASQGGRHRSPAADAEDDDDDDDDEDDEGWGEDMEEVD